MKRNVTLLLSMLVTIILLTAITPEVLAVDVDNRVPAGMYGIFVVNTKGEPVQGAEVEWKHLTESWIDTTNSAGYVDFPI